MFFFQAEDGIRDLVRSRGLGDVYKRQAVFDTVRPDTVIHTAAMTNVDACELDPVACKLQNVTATENLITASKKHNAHFIFLSTDFIFDGKNGPYREEDAAAPLSIYGPVSYTHLTLPPSDLV